MPLLQPTAAFCLPLPADDACSTGEGGGTAGETETGDGDRGIGGVAADRHNSAAGGETGSSGGETGAAGGRQEQRGGDGSSGGGRREQRPATCCCSSEPTSHDRFVAIELPSVLATKPQRRSHDHREPSDKTISNTFA